MAKICGNCVDFCDIERYTTVILICQHLTAAFKKCLKLKYKNVFLHNKTKIVSTLLSCIGSKDGLSLS